MSAESKSIDVDELREELEPHVADLDSEEGQEVINADTSHVKEIWEDGELTYTKGGELFRKRTLHMIESSFLDEDLWDVPEDTDHKSKVIIDDLGEQILRKYREKARNPE